MLLCTLLCKIRLTRSKMAVALGVILLYPAFIAAVKAAGELNILHSPESLKFTGRERLDQSLIREVFSASLGFSVAQGSDWSGLSISNPFNTPEAVVGIFIDGVKDLGSKSHLKGHQYHLNTDESEAATWQSLKHRISQRYPNGGNILVNVNLGDIDSLKPYEYMFNGVSAPKLTKQNYVSLKPAINDEDYQFLNELALLKTLTKKVKNGAITPDNVVDFYWIRFQSLHAVSDLHGAESSATKEAKALLGSAIKDLSDAFVDVYGGSVLVAAITSDASHTRRSSRSLLQAAQSDFSDLNLAKSYTANYPVMFNILLWFTVIFIFTLLAITYTIADMDPGRDSIIYRMTSTRIKKDN